MMDRLRIAGVALSAALLLTLTGVPRQLSAQDASPAAETLLPICSVAVAPSPDEALAAAYAARAGTSATPTPSQPVAESDLPAGEPADATTVAAADQTVRMWLSCLLSGEELAVLALQSDRLDQLFFLQHIQDVEQFRIVLIEDAASTPVPFEIPVLVPRDVRTLADGRIGGIWTLAGDASFVILSQENGAWVVDEIIDLIDDATPVP